MSRRKTETGTCHLCGCFGELSFDHVPPKGAMNNLKYSYKTTYEELRTIDPQFVSFSISGVPKGLKKFQGGIGQFSLCQRCNNNTGSWYAHSYVDWAHQCMTMLLKSNGQPTLWYPTNFYPLRVIKQICTMFLSFNSLAYRESYPELISFVVNKERKFLDPDFKIYAYYTISGNYRYAQQSWLSTFGDSDVIAMSEIAFPPFGFVLTHKSISPDQRLAEISFFSRFGYDEKIDFFQKLNPLPTHLPNIPGDYRTREEIVKAISESGIHRP